jgi:hypothetical protein
MWRFLLPIFQQLIEALGRDEFGQAVDLLSCKRIGRQHPDKPRDLLVYVRSHEQALAIIQSAKQLSVHQPEPYESWNESTMRNETEAKTGKWCKPAQFTASRAAVYVYRI